MNSLIEKSPSPLALISGSPDLSGPLADKLKKGSCEVIITDILPKSGKFDYIFLFGTVDQAYEAYLKLLKKDSRLLLITLKNNEDVARLKNLENIKVVIPGNPADWEAEELSETLLKI